MKTKANKIARVIVLPILLLFAVTSYAGNTGNVKNNECKCVSCPCKDCKESCGDKCEGKCCSTRTEGAACHKESSSKACCRAEAKTTAVGTTSATGVNAENTNGSSCCKTGTAAATSASCHKENPSRAACCKTGSVKAGASATGKCTGVCNEKCADCKDCKEKGCANCCTEDGCTKNGCCETKK